MAKVVWKEYWVTCCTTCPRELLSGWVSGHNAFSPGKRLHQEECGSFLTNLSIADMRVLVRNSAMRHPFDVTDYATGWEPGTTPPWEVADAV